MRRSVARLLVPWSCYLFVCVLLPLLNGAARAHGFWRHSGTVVTASLVMLFPWLLLRHFSTTVSAGAAPRRLRSSL
jgi:hypothetical protein